MYCYLSPIAPDGRVIDRMVLTNGEKDIELLGWDRREKERTGVFAELPPEQSWEGRRPVLYADISRQTCWYQWEAVPTPEAEAGQRPVLPQEREASPAAAPSSLVEAESGQQPVLPEAEADRQPSPPEDAGMWKPVPAPEGKAVPLPVTAIFSIHEAGPEAAPAPQAAPAAGSGTGGEPLALEERFAVLEALALEREYQEAQRERKEGTRMIYDLLQSVIRLGKPSQEEIEKKLTVFLQSGRITQEQYRELTELAQSIPEAS